MRLSSCPLRADSFGVHMCRNCGCSQLQSRQGVDVPARLTVLDVPVLLQRRLGSCWRCLSLSSSPELVDIPATETGVRLGSGGDEGVGAHHTGDELN